MIGRHGLFDGLFPIFSPLSFDLPSPTTNQQQVSRTRSSIFFEHPFRLNVMLVYIYGRDVFFVFFFRSILIIYYMKLVAI
jgi:hypothetical protein